MDVASTVDFLATRRHRKFPSPEAEQKFRADMTAFLTEHRICQGSSPPPPVVTFVKPVPTVVLDAPVRQSPKKHDLPDSDINSQNRPCRWSLLHEAVMTITDKVARQKRVRELLAQGCDPLLKDNSQDDAIQKAQMEGQEDIVKIIREFLRHKRN